MVLGFLGTLIALERAGADGRRWPFAAPACGAAAVLWLVAGGPRLGAALLLASAGQVAWLVRHDLARYTVRATGLPRYVAVCLLAGYGWLAVSGVLWVVLGLGPGGHLLHDAAVHALFLGFVMSMVFGHAPIVLPAVLGVPLRYHPAAYAPLALLHGSVLVRVVADLAGSEWWRGMAAHGNVTALLAFVGVAVVTTLVAARADRRRTSEDARPVG